MYEMSSSKPFAGDGTASGSRFCGGDYTSTTKTLGLQVFCPHPLLSDIVEDIWDWDLPDGAIAQSMTVQLPPSAYAVLLMQYRAPLSADWTFGTDKIMRACERHVAIKMQTGIVTVRPVGPVGAVIVRVKPEASERISQSPLSEFRDQKIELSHLFRKGALIKIEQDLARAPDAEARVAFVEEFLLRYMRPSRPPSLLAQAASSLRFDPSISVSDLATHLDISVRHLSRGFKAAFGVGPKQFARLVRVEKAVAARRDGCCWSDIAQSCGFADQAHLIHDFQAIVGVAPEEIFRPPGMKTVRPPTSSRGRSFFNLFVD
jgi:AraC-like DNA-binding protein